MAALALIMAGCSNNEDDVKIDNGEVANAVPIQISQRVAGVETKAAVTLGSKMKAVILMVDEGENTGSPDFSSFNAKTENTLTDDGKGGKQLESDENRAHVANTEFQASLTAGDIKLNPTLYYPLTDSKVTWLLGVSPQGTVDATKVTFSVADGSQDVMYAAKQSAGASNANKTTPELEFKHKTTQLLFVAQLSDDNLSNTEWKDKSVSVQSIIIQKAQVPTAITISNGDLECKEMNITVAGCKEALKKTPCAKSVPVMIQEAAKVVVDIVLTVGSETITYSNLEVKAENGTDNLATSAGKSHLITFTITAPVTASDGTMIETKAKIVDWEAGDPGKVEIK